MEAGGASQITRVAVGQRFSCAIALGEMISFEVWNFERVGVTRLGDTSKILGRKRKLPSIASVFPGDFARVALEALFAFREACVSRLELRTGEASLFARVSADPIGSCVFEPLHAVSITLRQATNTLELVAERPE